MREHCLPISAIILSGIAVRAVAVAAMTPWIAGDSGWYLAVAYHVTHLELGDGWRGPIYPAFLAAVQILVTDRAQPIPDPATFSAIAVAQSILGLASALLLYATLTWLNVNRWLRLVACLLFATLSAVAVFERIVLSEAYTLFAIALLTASLVWVVKEFRRRGVVAIAIVGLNLGIVALVRPPNLLTVVAILISLLVAAAMIRSAISRVTTKLAAFAAVPILAWCLHNYVETNHFTPANSTGLQLAISAYNLFDRLKGDDALRDVMIRHKAKSTRIVRRDYIWDAFFELLENYKTLPPQQDVDFPIVEVSHYLGGAAIELIRQNPLEWLSNGFEQFADVLDCNYIPSGGADPPDPVSPTGGSVVKNLSAWNFLYRTGVIQGWIIAALIALCAASILVAPALMWAGRVTPQRGLIWFSFAAGVVATLVGYCFLAAYQPRYSLPYIPMMIVVAALAMDTVLVPPPAK